MLKYSNISWSYWIHCQHHFKSVHLIKPCIFESSFLLECHSWVWTLPIPSLALLNIFILDFSFLQFLVMSQAAVCWWHYNYTAWTTVIPYHNSRYVCLIPCLSPSSFPQVISRFQSYYVLATMTRRWKSTRSGSRDLWYKVRSRYHAITSTWPISYWIKGCYCYPLFDQMEETLHVLISLLTSVIIISPAHHTHSTKFPLQTNVRGTLCYLDDLVV